VSDPLDLISPTRLRVHLMYQVRGHAEKKTKEKEKTRKPRGPRLQKSLNADNCFIFFPSIRGIQGFMQTSSTQPRLTFLGLRSWLAKSMSDRYVLRSGEPTSYGDSHFN